MIHFFGSMIGLAITAGASGLGFWQARQFTHNRLRYVDAVHKASVPVLVGIAAALIATPVAWLVPLIGTGTALLFGGAVALGVNAGARDIRRRITAG
jgi:hypothetical protein